MLADQLRDVVPAELVTDEPAELALRATDFWPALVMARRGGTQHGRPEVVVSPTSTEQVSAVLRWCHQREVPVVPFGAGTGVVGGAVAEPGGVTLDLKRLDRVLDLDDVSGTVTVEPGIVAQRLEDHLAHRGWTLGHYPSSIHCSTIGGFLAIRSAGQASTGYGKLEERVLGLQAVLADGTVVELRDAPSSAAGPDLKRLFIGGEGTTGVITRATLALEPAPDATIDHGVLFADLATAVEAARRVMRGGVHPTVFRLYDEADTALVFGSQGLEVPEGCLVVFSAEGTEEVAGFVHQVVLRTLRDAGGDDLGPGPGEHWRAHRHDVSYRFAQYMKPAGEFGDAVMLDTMEVATVWSRVTRLYDAVRAALQQHCDVVLAHISHLYPTGASIYFTFGAAPVLLAEDPPSDPEAVAMERYRAAWDAGQRAALGVGATISHHHGIGLLRVPWFPEELGAGGTEVLRRVKDALDPRGVLNPGKLGLGRSSRSGQLP